MPSWVSALGNWVCHLPWKYTALVIIAAAILTISGATILGILLCVLSFTQLLMVFAAAGWLKSRVAASASYSFWQRWMKSGDSGTLISDQRALAIASSAPFWDRNNFRSVDADPCKSVSLRSAGIARVLRMASRVSPEAPFSVMTSAVNMLKGETNTFWCWLCAAMPVSILSPKLLTAVAAGLAVFTSLAE